MSKPILKAETDLTLYPRGVGSQNSPAAIKAKLSYSPSASSPGQSPTGSPRGDQERSDIEFFKQMKDASQIEIKRLLLQNIQQQHQRRFDNNKSSLKIQGTNLAGETVRPRHIQKVNCGQPRPFAHRADNTSLL